MDPLTVNEFGFRSTAHFVGTLTVVATLMLAASMIAMLVAIWHLALSTGRRLVRVQTTSLITLFVLSGSHAYAGPIGFSWDSSGPCSAQTIVSGVPCALNPAAQGAAANAGTPMAVLDLEDGALEAGLLGPITSGFYAFNFLAEFTDDWGLNELGWWTPTQSGVIFSAAQGIGSTSTVWMPDGARFSYRNTAPGSTELFEDLLQPRQFSPWHRGATSFLGFEDIASAFITPSWTPYSSDYDHNDAVISFERVAKTVPEPTTLTLFGLGLIVAARRMRRAWHR